MVIVGNHAGLIVATHQLGNQRLSCEEKVNLVTLDALDCSRNLFDYGHPFILQQKLIGICRHQKLVERTTNGCHFCWWDGVLTILAGLSTLWQARI